MLRENTVLQGRYQILEPIGRGGMGAVYKALDLRLRSVVALKETLLTGEVVRKAFEREAQLLAGLRHPALPKVSDHFTEGDGQFLVMEFIPGADFGKLITQREGPFALTEVLRWAASLLGALEYLHSHAPPVVHRDIKPQNMKLTDRGEIILLDFGLAKGAAAQATRAENSSIFGYTPHYAPLEQVQGSGTDPRSDLYSLAATLYHLLTGAPPPDALARAAAKINEEPDPLALANTLNPQVTPQVAAVLNRALSQKPDQRFPTAAAMAQALQAAAQGAMVTDSLPENTAKLPNPAETMVIVPRAEATLLHIATPASLGSAVAATSTTLTNPDGSTGSTHAKRPAWLLPAIGAALLAVGVSVALLFASGLGGGMAQPSSTSIPSTAVSIAVAQATPAAETAAPTAAEATAGALTNAELLQTAAVLQTAEAQQRADELATARVLVNAVDGAETQTAIALTPTATALPTDALPTDAASTPTESVPANTSLPAPTAPPANTSRPAPTRDPNQPTVTPRPTNPPASAIPSPTQSQAQADVITTGSGRLFRGSANLGTTDPGRGAGGSCIEGRVTAADGGLLGRFGVQVDYRGSTRQAQMNTDSGTYSICGLTAGEWGVSVYLAAGVDIPGGEQVAHQVRVQLTGTPGEIFFINFAALPAFSVPTPTAAPAPSQYDGVWRGTNAGTTTTGEYPPGRFEIEVKNNAIYRISVDGPSCPFETYPNYPSGIPISGNSFGVSGSVFNPITGANDSITLNVSGAFTSTTSGSGTLSAQQNGAPCANASWNAKK